MEYPEDVLNEIVERRLKKEITKGVQTIEYQVITLMTTNGQAPFLTVFMYLNEAKNEREKKDLAMIIEETLRQRYQGVKNEAGVWVTPAFPKLIYVLEEDNIREGSKYWYLTKQLENFKTQCRPSQQDLIPMIDVEVKQGLGTEAFCDSLLKFLDMVEVAYHQKPLVYTGTNFYNRYLAGKLNGYKLMIAQYSANEPVLIDDNDYLLWQYTGKGHIDGIRGYVDKSRFMGQHSMRELKYRHH